MSHGKFNSVPPPAPPVPVPAPVNDAKRENAEYPAWYLEERPIDKYQRFMNFVYLARDIYPGESKLIDTNYRYILSNYEEFAYGLAYGLAGTHPACIIPLMLLSDPTEIPEGIRKIKAGESIARAKPQSMMSQGKEDIAKETIARARTEGYFELAKSSDSTVQYMYERTLNHIFSNPLGLALARVNRNFINLMMRQLVYSLDTIDKMLTPERVETLGATFYVGYFKEEMTSKDGRVELIYILSHPLGLRIAKIKREFIDAMQKWPITAIDKILTPEAVAKIEADKDKPDILHSAADYYPPEFIHKRLIKIFDERKVEDKDRHYYTDHKNIIEALEEGYVTIQELNFLGEYRVAQLMSNENLFQRLRKREKIEDIFPVFDHEYQALAILRSYIKPDVVEKIDYRVRQYIFSRRGYLGLKEKVFTVDDLLKFSLTLNQFSNDEANLIQKLLSPEYAAFVQVGPVVPKPIDSKTDNAGEGFFQPGETYVDVESKSKGRTDKSAKLLRKICDTQAPIMRLHLMRKDPTRRLLMSTPEGDILFDPVTQASNEFRRTHSNPRVRIDRPVELPNGQVWVTSVDNNPYNDKRTYFYDPEINSWRLDQNGFRLQDALATAVLHEDTVAVFHDSASLYQEEVTKTSHPSSHHRFPSPVHNVACVTLYQTEIRTTYSDAHVTCLKMFTLANEYVVISHANKGLTCLKVSNHQFTEMKVPEELQQSKVAVGTIGNQNETLLVLSREEPEFSYWKCTNDGLSKVAGPYRHNRSHYGVKSVNLGKNYFGIWGQVYDIPFYLSLYHINSGSAHVTLKFGDSFNYWAPPEFQMNTQGEVFFARGKEVMQLQLMPIVSEADVLTILADCCDMCIRVPVLTQICLEYLAQETSQLQLKIILKGRLERGFFGEPAVRAELDKLTAALDHSPKP